MSEATNHQSTIHCIKKGHAGASIVFAPDIGGNVIYARKILSKIGEDVSAFGLRMTPNLIASLPHLSLQDIANQFAVDLKASEIPEPYHLVGHSFAGLFAYEVAHSLQAQGAKVGVVALLDTAAPTKYYIGSWFRLVTTARRFKDKLHASTLNLKLLLLPKKAKSFKLYPGFFLLDLSKHTSSHVFVIENLYNALVRYRPSHSKCQITIFSSETLWRLVLYPKYLGWNVFAPNLNLIGLKFDHNEFVESDQAAGQVASCLSTLMRQTLNAQ